MFKIKLHLLLLISIAIYSCGAENTKIKRATTDYNLNIREALSQKEKQLNLSDFAKKIKYIPLETNESCLLKRVTYIQISKRYLFISDARSLY